MLVGGGDAQTPSHTTPHTGQAAMVKERRQPANEPTRYTAVGSATEPLVRVYLTGTSFTPTHTYYTHTHTQKSLTENVP